MRDSKIPFNWVSSTLGEIMSLDYGKGLPKQSRDSKGNYLVYGSNGVVGYHSKYLIEDDCLIVGRKGAVGKVHISNKPCWPIDTTYYVLPSSFLSLKYLYYLLNNLPLPSLDKSTAIPGINRNDVYAVKTTLAPLPEQYRIVEKLEELFTKLDAGVEELKQAKERIKQYRQSVLTHAFTGKLTEKWREDHINQLETENIDKAIDKMLLKLKWKAYSSQHIDANIISETLKTWRIKAVGNVIKIIDYRGRTPPYSDAGIPHLRSNNIKDGKIIYDALKYVTDETYDKYMTRGLPQEGDLLFTTEAPLGEVALSPSIKYSIAQRLMLLRPMPNVIHPKFLMYQLMSEKFQSQLKGKGTGTTVTGISSRNFKPMNLIIAPYKEQRIIVELIEEHFSIADKADETIEKSLIQSAALRQSILKKAFEGRLVPQDPNDEPASVLLERIKAEKEKLKKKSKTVSKRKAS